MKKFWIWISLLGGLLTVVDSAHELVEEKKNKKQLLLEDKEQSEEAQ